MSYIHIWELNKVINSVENLFAYDRSHYMSTAWTFTKQHPVLGEIQIWIQKFDTGNVYLRLTVDQEDLFYKSSTNDPADLEFFIKMLKTVSLHNPKPSGITAADDEIEWITPDFSNLEPAPFEFN